jgi:hypothetical protein
MTNQDNSVYTTDPNAGARFRKTLVRVMAVQIVSLVLLWLLQQHYTA